MNRIVIGLLACALAASIGFGVSAQDSQRFDIRVWERDGEHAVSIRAEGQRWQPTTRIALDREHAGWRYADTTLSAPLASDGRTYADGYAAGAAQVEAARSAGYSNGLRAGRQEGYANGRSAGYQEGYAAGQRAATPATRSSCDEQWIASHAAQLAQAEVASINARNDDIRRAREAGARFTAPIVSPNYTAIYNRHVRDLRTRYC